jgi:hypothetical protein
MIGLQAIFSGSVYIRELNDQPSSDLIPSHGVLPYPTCNTSLKEDYRNAPACVQNEAQCGLALKSGRPKAC